MQHIQDNEFDQLFKDRFEEAEVTPSVNLWDRIETQLVEKPRRVFPVYWLAAAVAVAALSAGLLLNNTASDHQQTSNRIAMVKVPQKEVIVERKRVTEGAIKTKPAVIEPKTLSSGIKAEYIALQDPKKDLAAMQPLALNTHHDHMEIAVHQEKLSLPELSSAEGIVLAGNEPKTENGDAVINENENKTENKGIRNMGDLINYVVDKVDKSDEKVIQFKTDDDNSSLIALNIGIIRFNTKKHK